MCQSPVVDGVYLYESRDRLHIETLIVWKQNTETQGKGHQQAEVGCQKLEEVLRHRGEHLDVNS